MIENEHFHRLKQSHYYLNPILEYLANFLARFYANLQYNLPIYLKELNGHKKPFHQTTNYLVNLENYFHEMLLFLLS